ncbi:MAG TPA: hypothetical protein PLI11_03065 [Clostridia bacterium]|jgi:hypothetical protein|nr:hypothetical protein [Clostridiaceae bacterium]HPZ51875.1 hypothetical protein [Clostridia bacterium]
MFRLIYNKKLLVDSSAEEFARVRANLDEKNIPCYIKTVKSSPTILQSSYAQSYQRYAMSYSPAKDHVSYVYYIYVKRKDYDKARLAME